MSDKIISAKNISKLENFEVELNNIIYILELLINSDDFFTLKKDEKSLSRLANCQLAIHKNLETLEKYSDDFHRFIECIEKEENYA